MTLDAQPVAPGQYQGMKMTVLCRTQAQISNLGK